MEAKAGLRLWFAILVTSSLRNVNGDKAKVEGRQLFGGAGFPGFLSYQDLAALSTNKAEVIKQYPYQQPQEQFQFIPDTLNRPLLSGGQFLGQLGQYIQQGLGQYQQAGAPPQLYQQYPPPGATSITEALMSIAKYDDLKCVPRLLCEVAAGGRPGYTSAGKQTGGIPFLNRDTLMSLLTVFNFGDTSPLMTFGRAILLGITAKNDPKTCFSAYPLCPRDPDNLVDYLNNHNGGFFKFFGGQRPYIPSRPYGRIQNGAHHITGPPGRIQDLPVQRPSRGPKQLQFPNVYPPPMTQNVNAFRDPDYFRKEKLSLLFPNNENAEEVQESNFFDNKGSANSALNTFYFPDNVNNEDSHTYYVNEQSPNYPDNTFYFPGSANKGQSFESNLYNKRQPPAKTKFFPNDNGQTTDSNLYNYRDTVKAVNFPPIGNNLHGFRVERPSEDLKKVTSPMTFPDQNESGNFRFETGKINRQVLGRPTTNFSGTRKPNFVFGYERSKSPNSVKNPEKQDKRNKREEADGTSTGISSNHNLNADDYEIIQDNAESLKYSSDDSDHIYGIEE